MGGWVLGAGVNTLTANLEGASGSPVTFSAFGVTVPTMSIDKPSLVFGAIDAGTGFSTQTSTQTVRLTQTGTGAVTWTAAPTVPWLTVSPASGSGAATLSVAAQFVTNLAASQAGAVTLTSTGAGNTIAPIADDLAVFAWSDARGEFLPATVVRVRLR